MRETTITLTDMQVERLEEEQRRQGLPTDALIRLAIDAFLDLNGAATSSDPHQSRDRNGQSSESGVAHSAPHLWFVGLDRGDHSDTDEHLEHTLADEYQEYLIEDSFGGSRNPDLSPRNNHPSESSPDDQPRSPG